MPEVLHLKSTDMKFSQHFRDAGGHMSQCRLITPEISKAVGAGIATYDGCSIEWTTKYEQVAIVLEGILRIRTGIDYSRVIEATVGDVIFLPKGAKIKYEGDKAKMFYAPAPNDWRISSALTVLEAAAEHFRAEQDAVELVSATRVENWTAYEVKGFLDLIIAESGNRKLRVVGFRLPQGWCSAVGAIVDSAEGGVYNNVPVTVAGVEGIEIVFRPS
jgi:hypothetical protein